MGDPRYRYRQTLSSGDCSMNLASGHQVEELQGEELARQERDFLGSSGGLVRLIPGRWLLPWGFLTIADRLYNFKFRQSDVVVMTWAKCGTTWMQEIIWSMRHNPDLDHPMTNTRVGKRCHFLELDMMLAKKPQYLEQISQQPWQGKNTAGEGRLQTAEVAPDPRTLKTHLPFSLLPPSLLHTAKVVCVARNPKDVIVSYHHHSRLFKGRNYQGTLDDFVHYFVNDDLVYGSYGLHLKEAWEQRHHPNLHFVFYEDMKADIQEEIRKLDSFLDTNLTKAQMDNVARHSSFSEMKGRNAAMGVRDEEVVNFNQDVRAEDGGFFRKGEVGSWKSKLTPQLEDKVNNWMEKNLSSLGITFKGQDLSDL